MRSQTPPTPPLKLIVSLAQTTPAQPAASGGHLTFGRLASLGGGQSNAHPQCSVYSDAVIKQLLAPYVTERIHTLVKEFGSSQTVRFLIVRTRIVYDSCRSVDQVERQLGYYHKDRFENHFRVTNKNFTDDQIAAGIAA